LSLVPKEVSVKEFKVLLGELSAQTDVIATQRSRIQGLVEDIRGAFQEAEYHFNSPAGESFTVIAGEFNSDAEALDEYLADIVGRMRHTYAQYRTTENTATRSVDAQHNSMS
jgi:uncharacterized protein YukE